MTNEELNDRIIALAKEFNRTFSENSEVCTQHLRRIGALEEDKPGGSGGSGIAYMDGNPIPMSYGKEEIKELLKYRGRADTSRAVYQGMFLLMFVAVISQIVFRYWGI